MGKHKNKFSPRRSADDDLSAATAAAADGGDDGLLSPAADTDEVTPKLLIANPDLRV